MPRLIVAIGGTTRPHSSTERVLGLAAEAARCHGAEVQAFGGAYIEELSVDTRPYLEGRPVGLIVTAFGHQAANSSMTTLRTIAHALRGWPTPFGAALKVGPDSFDQNGDLLDGDSAAQLRLVGSQVAHAAGRL
jgi:FMN reductase